MSVEVLNGVFNPKTWLEGHKGEYVADCFNSLKPDEYEAVFVLCTQFAKSRLSFYAKNYLVFLQDSQKAEDLVQDAVTGIIASNEKLKVNMKSLLFQAIKNKIFSYLRSWDRKNVVDAATERVMDERMIGFEERIEEASHYEQLIKKVRSLFRGDQAQLLEGALEYYRLYDNKEDEGFFVFLRDKINKHRSDDKKIDTDAAKSRFQRIKARTQQDIDFPSGESLPHKK